MPAPDRLNPYSTVFLAGGVLSVAVALGMAPAPPPVHEAGEDESEQESLDLLARTMAKDAVIREVDTGRMSVPAAAAVFEWLNRQPPAAARVGSCHVTYNAANADLLADVRTESDLLCVNVVAYARASRSAPPGRLAEMADEYRRACAVPGGAVLPEVVESDCRELAARAGIVRARRMTRPGEFRVSLDGLRLVAE